jgi:integrase
MGKIIIRKRGSIYQYRFEIAEVKGKRKWYSKSGFKTKVEALEMGNVALTEYLNAGAPFKENKMSYSDYLDYWVKNYCESNLKYNTIQTYKTLIEKYIKPTLGMYQLSSLTSVKLNTFMIDIVNKHNFSRTYFKNILKVLKGSFRDACNLYGFIKYNPAITIRMPKIEGNRVKPNHLYTQEQIDKILDRLKDDSTFVCSFITACYTGMRTGEVFALTWDNIDFDNNLIHIEHNIYDKPKDKSGRWFIGSTKTETGTREVWMCDTLKSALLNFKSRQDILKKLYGKEYKYYHLEDVKNNYGKVVEKRIVLNNQFDNDYINLVFTKEDGTYSGTDTIRYPFKIIHDELGINNRFYDLRGSYATKILNNGTGLREVADILGHRNIETTENFYISSLKESRKKAIDNLDSIISSNTINNAIKFEATL